MPIKHKSRKNRKVAGRSRKNAGRSRKNLRSGGGDKNPPHAPRTPHHPPSNKMPGVQPSSGNHHLARLRTRFPRLGNKELLGLARIAEATTRQQQNQGNLTMEPTNRMKSTPLPPERPGDL